MTTLATDNFIRANGLIDVGNSAWAAPFGKNKATIVSNAPRLVDEAVDCGGVWTGLTWANDQWAQQIVTVLNYADCTFQVFVRGGTAAMTWYGASVVGPLGASAKYQVFKRNAGAFTALSGAPATFTFNANDVVYLGIQGTTLTMQRNGSVVWSGTDGSIASGSPGFFLSTQAETVADSVGGTWSGGDFTTMAGPTIINRRNVLYFI